MIECMIGICIILILLSVTILMMCMALHVLQDILKNFKR